jgi:hypothetical protein
LSRESLELPALGKMHGPDDQASGFAFRPPCQFGHVHAGLRACEHDLIDFVEGKAGNLDRRVVDDQLLELDLQLV